MCLLVKTPATGDMHAGEGNVISLLTTLAVPFRVYELVCNHQIECDQCRPVLTPSLYPSHNVDTGNSSNLLINLAVLTSVYILVTSYLNLSTTFNYASFRVI